MSLACQRDSYLTELHSEVTRCQPAQLKITRHGRKEVASGFEVTCADTVLFPEGGGQNTDRGTLNGLPVLRVTRKGEAAIHFVEGGPGFEPGSEVKQMVDWPRRFDHMQQHSGQHLISALFEHDLGIDTTSWWMAEDTGDKVGVSYVELDRPSFTEEVVQAVEDKCNQAIRDHLEVTVHVYPNAQDPALLEAHTRGLPNNVTGPVRVIQIGTLDTNMCCGTHVRNLSELQSVKILSVEKGKKGKCLLNFLVGNRVLRYLACTFKREQALTHHLKGGPDDHVDLVMKYVRNLKTAQKSLQNAFKELAIRDANLMKAENRGFALMHRKDADADYMNCLIHEISEQNTFLCVVIGDDGQGPCQMAIVGPEPIVQELGPRLIKILDAKGGGQGSRISAKVTSLKSWPLVQAEVEAHFQAN
eukprot:maker-scaffold67_size430214-snap-gene-3.31 protein:Tk00793 transcript:maker-scaffold67_size430214-snap-gene-3.31-mRNA-1 annotation:"hypothetical protein DAPPUDRAFT_312382"